MPLNPGRGVLRNDHFQIAYVTNDLERACDLFSQRYGIKSYAESGGHTPNGFDITVKLAWVGGVMFELIYVEGLGGEFYNSRLPADGSFAIRHHHLGYFVEDEAAWADLEREVEAGGWEVVFRNGEAGLLKVFYINAPELGHYLEYILPEAAGAAFFESVPVS